MMYYSAIYSGQHVEIRANISLLIQVIGPNNMFELKVFLVHSGFKFHKPRAKFQCYDRHGVSMFYCSCFPAMIHPKNGIFDQIRQTMSWSLGGSYDGSNIYLPPETCCSQFVISFSPFSRFPLCNFLGCYLTKSLLLDSVLKKHPSKFVGCCLANPAEDGSGVKQLEHLVLKVFGESNPIIMSCFNQWNHFDMESFLMLGWLSSSSIQSIFMAIWSTGI